MSCYEFVGSLLTSQGKLCPNLIHLWSSSLIDRACLAQNAKTSERCLVLYMYQDNVNAATPTAVADLNKAVRN